MTIWEDNLVIIPTPILGFGRGLKAFRAAFGRGAGLLGFAVALRVQMHTQKEPAPTTINLLMPSCICKEPRATVSYPAEVRQLPLPARPPVSACRETVTGHLTYCASPRFSCSFIVQLHEWESNSARVLDNVKSHVVATALGC